MLGSLIEKEITTPDQYPLSLNALTNACNQKSNRYPVLELSQYTVQQALDELKDKRLVVEDYGGGRVEKYKHRFCNTEFGSLKFTEQELGIICVLLLRGPQTPGELRSRTNRLCKFRNLQEVDSVLQGLMDAPEGPFVVKLPHEPGRREFRYAHLFSGEVDISASYSSTEDDGDTSESGDDRISRLEQQVEQLQAEIQQIKAILQDHQG